MRICDIAVQHMLEVSQQLSNFELWNDSLHAINIQKTSRVARDGISNLFRFHE